MKILTWKLVVPLAIISFAIFTKWWFVLPVDAPHTMMSGFPLIWVADGWHTSLSLQIFLSEMMLNLGFQFCLWWIIIFFLNKQIDLLKIPKWIVISLFSISGTFIFIGGLIGSMPEHIYHSRRNYDVEVLSTGYKFFWQTIERPTLDSDNQISE